MSKKRSASPGSRTPRFAGNLEALEARLFLSGLSPDDGLFGTPVPGVTSIVQWYGSPLHVRNGTWVMGFDGQLGEAGAKARALAVAAQLGVPVTAVQSIGRGRWASIKTTGVITEAAVARVRATIPGVLGIQPDRVYEVEQIPNDPMFANQYWHDNTGQFGGVVGADINTPAAWDITIGSQSVIIGVVDTGVQLNHPDLVANIWHNPGEVAGNGLDDDGNGFVDDVNGWDFGELDNDPEDDPFVGGHGTPVAGCIGAVGNNGIGLTGVAWSVSILPLKIADRYGILSIAAIVGAHDYATMMLNRGHNIVATNNSYRGIAGEFYSDAPAGFDPEKDSIQAYVDAGGTFVAAAGNDTLDNDSSFRAFPASYNIPGVISVAATDPADGIAGFSNYGAETVHIGAPGVVTFTTHVLSGYGSFGGTSAASPITAGAVALLKTFKPNASAVEIRQALMDGVDPIAALQGKVVSGGRLNVARSLFLIGLEGPVIREVSPGPVTAQTDINTGQVIRSIALTFNKPIDPATLASAGIDAVELRRDGADNTFNTPDDQVIAVASVVRSASDEKTVIITLNLAGFPQQRLPLDKYRLTLAAEGFKDTNGNFLNGTSTTGSDEVYSFQVIAVTAPNETNDTILTATPVVFSASGTAVFNSAVIGNGLAGPLDVDLYRIDIPRGGLITAEVRAKRLPVPSDLDSVLRLFNAFGVAIALNDQFYGSDSFIDFFVTTGGTYYLGVSGFSNMGYNALLAGSGSAQALGGYDLSIKVQLVSNDHVTASSVLPAPERIPAGGTQGTISDTITVNDSRQILDVNVRLTLTHDFRGDLVISLISPAGTAIVLVNRRGGSGPQSDPNRGFGNPNQGTSLFLDDEATSPISTLSPNQSGAGAFRPDTAVGTFDGEAALGTWTLLINDTTSLNSGFLHSWSIEFVLSNDIFGPFESNDTIVTARDLTQISATGSGSTARDAFIGDGGFGVFDRDIFRLTVAAGATLTAQVTSTPPPGSSADDAPTLNTALRLFDAVGHEVTVSNPSGTLDSAIQKFVFHDAGTYYLAVSEGSNTGYDPFNPVSGTAAATTGYYTLSVLVANGVSDGPMILEGNSLSVGFNPSGTLQSAAGMTGAGNGTVGLRWNGIEFLFDEDAQSAAPRSFFGGSAGGIGFVNRDTVIGPNAVPTTQIELPLAIVNQSDAFNRRVVSNGLFGNLRVERTLSFGVNDSFVAFDVVLTNLGGSSLSEVSWMEGFDPSPGLNLFPLTAATGNDVDNSDPLVSARFINNEFQEGLTVALAAPESDSRARATVVSNLLTTIRDSGQLLSLPQFDPNGAASQSYIALAFDLGELGPAGAANSSVRMRYFIFFGSTPGEIDDMYASLNDGSGVGHLAVDPANPASENLTQPDGESITSIPMLPYRAFYPEGYANFDTYTFVPIMNPSAQSNHVVVIARYERNPGNPDAIRDQVIADFVIAPASRSGITITTPEMYADGSLLVRRDVPYALEIRSQTPVAATFSHYDQFLLAGARAAIGESFTTRVNSEWTFAQVARSADPDAGESDFILFMNTSDEIIKVDTTFYSRDGGQPITLTQELEPYRRGGWNINDLPQLPAGVYGVAISAEGPIVASLSHYDRQTGSASGLAGVPTAGSTSGVIPEGQLGLGSTREQIGILNPSDETAVVTFSFLLSSGSTYRHVLDVDPQSQAIVDVGSLPQFPTGQTYSVLYESTVPVSLSLQSLAFGEGLAAGFSDLAYTYWGFGEGFRPPSAPDGFNNVTESLRLFNPSSGDVLVEITIRFDNDLGEETFRRVVPSRRTLAIDVATLVTGARRDVLAFYGITVKSASPIVASFDHYDRFFPGAFSTLGTPLGLSESIS